jgi:hypothetical protein
MSRPLSNERLSKLVADVVAGKGSLRGVRLARTVVSKRREAGAAAVDTAVSDAEAKVRAALGGDIVGRIVPFVISTPDRAEDGHTLDPPGVDQADYERVPHVFWAHEYSGWRASPSRAAVRIATSIVTADAKAVTAQCGFYTRDFSTALDGGFSYAIGELAARQGHRASVGFDIVEAALAPEDVRKTIPWALDISAWRLNEWSLVNFGADANAITEGRADGVDVEPIARALEQFLDDLGAVTGVARDKLAAMWAAAADPGRRQVVAPPSSPAPAVPGVAADADIRAAIRDSIAAALTPRA